MSSHWLGSWGKRSHRRLWRSLLVLSLIIGIAAAVSRPSDLGKPYAPAFSTLNEEVRALKQGAPAALVDLDALDENLSFVKLHASRANAAVRIVVKSLPSIDLLRYLSRALGTRRFMVFHQAHLDLLYGELGSDVDVLLGKPMPADAAFRTKNLTRPQWLIDSSTRLNEYLERARAANQRILVSLEIDIGLHRGGAANNDELAKMLTVIRDNPNHLKFAGFMGYDGHAPHAPAILQGRTASTKAAWSHSMDAYRDFLSAARNGFPDLFRDQSALTFNSGGSRTYMLFDGASPSGVNDVALGSAFLKPADYDDELLSEHRASVFLATPVLKKMSRPPLPFLDALWPIFALWDPNVAVGFYVYGGAWAAVPHQPPGIGVGPFQAAPGRNVLPNQALFVGSKSVPLNEGDFVFLRPMESDAIGTFEKILTIRRGHVTSETWKPLPILN